MKAGKTKKPKRRRFRCSPKTPWWTHLNTYNRCDAYTEFDLVICRDCGMVWEMDEGKRNEIKSPQADRRKCRRRPLSRRLPARIH